MRDNLDLQELRERSDYYRNQSQRIRNRSLILLLGIFIAMAWLYVQVKDPIGVIYVKNDGWDVFSSTAPVDMQFDSDGTLWIQSLYHSTMFAMNQYEWSEFRGREIIDKYSEFDGSFDAHAGNIWLQHKQNLALFIENRWHYEENYFPQSQIQDFAINNQGRFFIDSSNTLYTDDYASSWRRANKNILLARSQSTPPSLIDVDDVMYLHYNGLQMFDGDIWQPILDLPDNSVFVGETDGYIWIRTDETLIQYDTLLEDEIQYFDLDKIDFVDATLINHVFTDNDNETYLVTDESIYQLIDGDWEHFETVDTLYGIQQVEVSPSGQWFIGSTNYDLLNASYAHAYLNFNLFYPAFAPFLIFCIVIYFWSARYTKVNVIRTERSRKLISALISDFKVDNKRVRQAKWLPIKTIAQLFLAAVAIIVTQALLYSNQLPNLLKFGISMLVFGIVLFFPMFIKAIKLWDKSEDVKRARHSIKQGFAGILSAAVFILVGDFVLQKIFPNNSLTLIPIVLYFVCLWAYSKFRMRQPARLLPKSLAQADYPKALKDMDNRLSNSATLLNSGAVQTYAGEYHVAKATYLQALNELQASSIGYLSITLGGLAYVMDRLGNFEEALKFYEASVIIFPEHPIPYQALVNAYNNNETEPQRTLEISNMMMNIIENSKPNQLLTLEGKGIYKMTHALALANAGQFDDVDTLVSEAKAEFDTDFIPGMASFYHMYGRILLAMGQVEEAKTSFNRSIQLDPNGDAGQLARYFMAEFAFD